MFTLTRHKDNPILLPSNVNDWEKRATFNTSVVKVNDTFHMVYRAQSQPMYYQGNSMQLSTIGYANSTDGVHFKEHKQLIKPDYLWELFGCEDPRVTYFDGKFYIFYTALSNYPFNAQGIKVGVAITKDFETIEEKHLVTPFNAKAMCIFPERINGKIVALLTANTDIPPAKMSLAFFDKEEEMWDEQYWKRWYSFVNDHAFTLLRNPKDQVEVGAVPVKTDKGWLLIYSYIRDYLTDQKIFGIEAVLLDKNNPNTILGRTTEPLLTPELNYEKFGEVANIVFPTGAVHHDDQLLVYYGGADTCGCVASCNMNDLLKELAPTAETVASIESAPAHTTLTRFAENPIIMPTSKHGWENKATFNPAVLYEQGKVHIVYRAMGENNQSTFGYAVSADGFHIDNRLTEPIYIPRESFEKNIHNPGNSGCEDPRITRIDDRYYMLYTAYDGGDHPPRVAMTSIAVNDFLNHKWHWAIPKLISPPEIDDKDACLFPKTINGKYVFLHRLQSAIWIDYTDDLHFYEGNYLGGKILFEPRAGNWDSVRIGISGPPIETEKGWLLIYHGINANHEYLISAALLKRDDPTQVLARLDYPLLGPEKQYERDGQVPNVVFPCGAVIINDELFVYYGGADSVVGVATMKVDKLLYALTT
jgi:beta-1,2-mannobiose phosphorylase / 1,2-beta-oligomannan phosphorylase